MTNKEKYTIDYIFSNNLILFDAITGSHAYGTNVETSDVDCKGFFCMKQDDLYGLDYVEQVSDEKGDNTYYEIGRFIELLIVNNPGILELLHSPEDCIKLKHPILDLLFQNKDKFITKLCKETFSNYSISQIRKCKGQDKMMNWEKDQVRRKTILDFCYIVEGYKTRSLKSFLKKEKIEQKFCGVVQVPHAKDLYSLFYDLRAHNCFSESVDAKVREYQKTIKKPLGFGYKGIMNEETDSNEIRLSSIPKTETPIAIFSYNKDGYIQHCKKYLQYTNWKKNRNMQRWVDVQGHNQKIDGKNLLHCMRLIDASLEIASGQGLNVRRPNAKELIGIRKGETDLETLIDVAENKIKLMQVAFDKSDLPVSVDYDFANNLLVEIRKNFYSLH